MRSCTCHACIGQVPHCWVPLRREQARPRRDHRVRRQLTTLLRLGRGLLPASSCSRRPTPPRRADPGPWMGLSALGLLEHQHRLRPVTTPRRTAPSRKDLTKRTQAIRGPVGEGGDEVSVARFIADQRTNYRVPHTLTCLLLGVTLAWFYKWRDRPPTPRQRRRADLDAAVAAMFDDAQGLHGSPRLHADLRADGWRLSEKTVADSMRRQGLIARKIKRRRGLTKQDKTAPKFPDLIKRNFTASAPNLRWCGDITEIPTGEGKLYLATVIDLYSRRLLAAATSLRCDADLCEQAIKIAVTVRGGNPKINNVVFHTDRGSTYTARTFTKVCSRLGVRQSMGRVGSCFDNAPRRRSSPAWNGKSCPVTSCATLIMLGPSCCPGAMSSITTAGGIAAPVC